MPDLAQNPWLVAGDTKVFSFAAMDSDSAALNLTGATMEWAMVPYRGAEAVVIKTTADASVTVTDAEGGLFEFTLEPEDTQEVARGRYPHGAKVTDASGNVSTISLGFVTILPQAVA